MINVGDLEPSELGAVLPGPLSHVVLAIHLDVRESNSIILIKSNSMLICVLLYDRNLKFHFILSNAHENVAQIGSSSVLNAKSEGICNIKHEVSIVHTLAVEDTLNELKISLSTFTCDGFFNEVS